MYTLYIANKNYSSWSLRPWVLMQELNIEFEEILTPFIQGSNWVPFRKFSPNGTVPCLHHNDNIIWDSLSIIEYLAERHDGVWPEDQVARSWARSVTAEMHSGFSHLRNICTMNCGLRIELATISDQLQKDIDRVNEIWEEGLAKFSGPFLAGSTFTAVDAFYAPVVLRYQTYLLPQSSVIKHYTKRILNLNSMQQWYEAAVAETWRESSHEQEAQAAGKITQDLRAT